MVAGSVSQGVLWVLWYVPLKPNLPGDSKCPFHPLVGGHLTPWKGHLTIPKRSLWITRWLGFLLKVICYVVPWVNHHHSPPFGILLLEFFSKHPLSRKSNLESGSLAFVHPMRWNQGYMKKKSLFWRPAMLVAWKIMPQGSKLTLHSSCRWQECTVPYSIPTLKLHHKLLSTSPTFPHCWGIQALGASCS